MATHSNGDSETGDVSVGEHVTEKQIAAVMRAELFDKIHPEEILTPQLLLNFAYAVRKLKPGGRA
jgi:hypothetical protein